MQRQALTTVRAACPHDCPDTCAMLVSVNDDGQAVQLRGDPEHPYTRGFLCLKVANYLERTYHPERLPFPLRRVGPKGRGNFERISWEDAIAIIAEKLTAIAQSPDGPQAILPYSYAGTMGKLQECGLDRRFFHRLGASKLDRTICATAGAVGSQLTLGARPVIDPLQIRNSRYIINWGSNTSVTNSHLWALMHQARKAGAVIVTIDPYCSPTAQKSDWWIPIRPGTDAALALGIMHILFRDSLEDCEYLNDYCLGVPELRQRAMEYPPSRVSEITGIPVEDIERLANEYGTSQRERGGPALIRLNYGLQRHGGGGMAVRTICCLPAITGDWRHPGGGAMLSTSRLFPFNQAALERPELSPPGTRTINMVQLAEALHGELPGPPVKALVVYNCNPAAVAPDQSRVLAGLRRDDLFTVVLEQFPTDTVQYADIVLPATTQLEHLDLHGSYGHLYVLLNQPAIAPLAEAKPNTEIFRRLAKAMGFEPELFDVSDEQLVELALSGGAPEFAGITLERLRRDGLARLNLPETFLPFAEGKGFGTPSGKCEFFSETLAKQGFDPLPTYIPPHEDPQTRPELAARYPLQMICPPAPAFLNSTFVNVDSLRRHAGEPFVEIHPEDAEARGIQEGMMVRIFNDRGRFQAKAQIGDRVKRGVVVAFGIWWNRFTADGANCNTVTSTAITDLGGGATFFDNLVEIAPV
ncbi:molybdopterin-containing oxidoreductase family protein [Tuwongella immobilis]|uniref:4Fe-4S Mo/W bis-MGD-type domain-containing protein n=1 Tax=Tuwongella immobilis TaxID=692036 RepID=A0A6C2YJG9_9BACT|nr:molybdopterin oxidoreductase family protein [Tuwongella immobilis]VIP01517.1 molybdopterin oxidoreductase : Anaerobic dehydrogenase, typically selenocysteine-containing OS=Singulisphaera acidiphila (strain ATCC BAA-1392 / DSM 18658 / VKM B-2454 / MOB10) GN=Sinac_5273 PE=4 SV=1: Molybdop_Fe4S4: Molybdopterin: Molydop_binding [Tuwongella immobilis]VTR98643.1 molybdopterin oxidoreductase : Anaerobic dehydrogenase, typically selenocysteine-containing OS=Singulisphaera acidiphila (strain ATCC BAA-1